jgi:hypothetical protein
MNATETTTTELEQKNPRSVVLLSTDGLSDSRRCANVLGAIALDVGLQRITPQTGNTMCNAIGKLLKLKEMEIKHGVAAVDGGPKRLALTD